MRRRKAVGVIVLMVICVSVLGTMVASLAGLDATGDIELGRLVKGDLMHVLASRSLWQSFPSLPGWRMLVHERAIVIHGVVLLLVLLLVRIRFRKSWLAAGMAVLVAIPCIYAAFAVALSNNTNVQNAGAWWAALTLGSLYSCVICMLFAGLECIFPHRRAAEQAAVQHVEFLLDTPQDDQVGADVADAVGRRPVPFAPRVTPRKVPGSKPRIRVRT